MKSYQLSNIFLSNIFLSIFLMNTMLTFMHTRLSMKYWPGKMWRRLSLLLGLITTLYMTMVWALPTCSFLNTISGMLKSSHSIQDNMLRWLEECTLYHHQRENSSFYNFSWLYLKMEKARSIWGPGMAKCLSHSRRYVWQEDYWRIIISRRFAWRKQLQYSLE